MLLASLDDSEEAPRGRAQHVMQQIVGYIREANLRVGERLPSEGQLSQRFGVSRPVVREAFGALSALGVVDVGNGRLPRVASVSSFPMVVTIDHALNTDQITFSQVWEVRRSLEVGAAASAALHRTDAQAAELHATVEAMARCDPYSDEMAQTDIAFHRLVAEASGNVLFQQIINSFHGLMLRAVPLAWTTRFTPAQIKDVFAKHAAVAEAIQNRDPSAAEAAMEAHFIGGVATILENSARQALR